MEVERESVSSFTQLKAMIARNVLLKKRLGRKTIAVSRNFKAIASVYSFDQTRSYVRTVSI